MQSLLSVPLPLAAFTHTLTQSEWLKAAKFTSTKNTAISVTVKSTTGYARILNHDGTWEAVDGSGNPAHNIAVTSKSPPADNKPSFYAIIPCDASGNLDGELTTLFLYDNQLTSFDGAGLSSVTSLNLSNNQLTSFDGTGLSSVTALFLHNNQLTSFDGTGLSSVTTLGLTNNQLTSFDGAGLSSLTSLNLSNNQFTSFDGTGLSLLTSLTLSNNQFTSFDGTGLSSLTDISLFGNQLTSFDGTGLSLLTSLTLSYNQLTSFDGTGLSSLVFLYFSDNPLATFENLSLPVCEAVDVQNNNLPSAELDELYTSLGVNPGTVPPWHLTGIYVAGNPGTTGDDPSIATAKGHTVYGS